MKYIPKEISNLFPHYSLMTKAQRKQRYIMCWWYF